MNFERSQRNEIQMNEWIVEVCCLSKWQQWRLSVIQKWPVWQHQPHSAPTHSKPTAIFTPRAKQHITHAINNTSFGPPRTSRKQSSFEANYTNINNYYTMSAEEVAKAFVQHFYQTFDTNVSALSGLYVSYHQFKRPTIPTCTLAFEFLKSMNSIPNKIERRQPTLFYHYHFLIHVHHWHQTQTFITFPFDYWKIQKYIINHAWNKIKYGTKRTINAWKQVRKFNADIWRNSSIRSRKYHGKTQ